jgi:hypothetical protein
MELVSAHPQLGREWFIASPWLRRTLPFADLQPLAAKHPSCPGRPASDTSRSALDLSFGQNSSTG